MSPPKISNGTGSKRPPPIDNNEAISLSQHEDEDAMDISDYETVRTENDYYRVTKRLKTHATIGQGNELLAISVTSANRPHIDTGLPTTRGTETNTTNARQPTQSLAQDVEDQANDVSPKGNKAGLLFSQMITANAPEEVKHLDAKYSFSSIEIGANSKHDQAVRAVVRLVGRFNLADIHMKPTIVVLSSMAKNAGRLIAIVEGAKAQIAADDDKWFQYNEMHGVIVSNDQKMEKRIGGGKTLREWDEEQKANAKAKEATVATEAAGGGEEDAMDVDEDGFQTMVRRKSEDLQGMPDSENDKIRHTPVMTVFIARLRIPEFAGLYGQVDYLPLAFTR